MIINGTILSDLAAKLDNVKKIAMKQYINPKAFNFSEQQLHTLLGLISDGVWDWNANTGCVYRNPGWYSMLGYPSDSLPSTVETWEMLIHPDDYSRVMTQFELCITRNEKYQVEYRCKCADGAYIWIEDRAHVIVRNEDGSVARMLGAHKNIDAAKLLILHLQQQNKSLEALVAERTAELTVANLQLQERLEAKKTLLERDSLTQAASRYGLERVLFEECEKAHLFHHPLSVIMVDVDNFKEINDEYGHIFGDKILVNVSECIGHYLRKQDLLARWGGDEFVLVFPRTPLEEAEQVAHLIKKEVSKIKISEYNNLIITLSFGVVQFLDTEKQTDFLERADKALYRAKRAGKNNVSR